MEGMFEIDVLGRNKDGSNRPMTIALTIGMGLRLIEDEDGRCWISLADNSNWLSPHDYATTRDQISGILRNL